MISAARIPRDTPAAGTATGTSEAEKFFTDIGNQVNSFLKNNFNEDTLKNFQKESEQFLQKLGDGAKDLATKAQSELEKLKTNNNQQ